MGRLKLLFRHLALRLGMLGSPSAPPERRSGLPGREPDVTVHYHCEEGRWWGEVPGWRWSCAGATLEECRELALRGVPYCLDGRLRAKSMMFMQIHETPLVKVTPQASESFRLYVPEA